jgi:hypothetical protein
MYTEFLEIYGPDFGAKMEQTKGETKVSFSGKLHELSFAFESNEANHSSLDKHRRTR